MANDPTTTYQNPRPRIQFLILGLIVIGVLSAWWLILHADRQMRQGWQLQARLVAQSLNPDHLRALSGSSADLNSPVYRHLKELLAYLRTANHKCRFIYLLGCRSDATNNIPPTNNPIFFFVDSESPDSKDYSPPGQIYEEIPVGFQRVFLTQSEAVEGPATDRWGTWVTALVPIRDPAKDSDHLLAVLAMDIDVRTWKRDVLARAAMPIGLTWATLTLLALSLFLVQSNRVICGHQAILLESERRAALQRTALAQLAVDQALINGNLSRALDRICEVLSTTVGVARTSIWKLAEDRSELRCLSLYQADHQTHSSGAVLDPKIFPAYFNAISSENRIYAEDAQHDPRTCGLTESYLKPLGITSLLDAGILFEGNFFGVVSCEHIGAKRKWHSDEESFVSTIAAIVAQLLIHTDRQRAEKERQNLQAQLIQAQKMESVGRLAGGVAHDFNNMLQTILGNAALALADLPRESPLRESLEEIQKSAQRSAALTRQLLAFARKQTVTPKVLDLNETVEGMLKMLRRLIGEDIDLAWLPGKHLGLVKIDPSQIDQILANLCVNARDAIGETGKVTIETDRLSLDKTYRVAHPEVVPGDYVRLAVSDTGCGMTQEILEHLFEPFFTTKAMGKGTGLGLATVYGIVKQNNGFVEVESQPGQGTTFKVYLPRYADATAPLEKTGHLQPLNRGHETILLVEDEPSILRVGKRSLESLGYQVLVASTPGEAIRLAEQYRDQIHLLITDVVMPEMNGRDLANRLLRLHPNLKRLFMSGYTSDVIAPHGVLDEGVLFIPKPFTISALAEKVRETLTRQMAPQSDVTAVPPLTE